MFKWMVDVATPANELNSLRQSLRKDMLLLFDLSRHKVGTIIMVEELYTSRHMAVGKDLKT